MKFGGTSVKDADAITRLCDIARKEARPRVIVVSALAGVTDQLVELASSASLRSQKRSIPSARDM